MPCRALAAGALALTAAASSLPARADGCDALTARLIRTTGASFAGRAGALVVFRAADAERMSLVCGPREMAFRSRYREPNRYYFVLIGLAAQGLLGANAFDVETLALRLHQAMLLTGETQEGRIGPARLRCEPADRFATLIDGLSGGTLCRLAPDRAPRSRGKAGLSVPGAAG